MIKTAIWDVGNVMLYFSMNPIYDGLSRYTDIGRDRIAQLLDDTPDSPGPDRLHNTGKITSLEFYQRVNDALNLRGIGFQEFSRIWCDIFTENKPVCDLVSKSGDQGYNLMILSNTDPINVQQAWRMIPHVLKRFKPGMIVTSYEVGVMKPDEKIYLECLLRSGSRPEECVFIDDKAKYVEVAERLGINGLLYDYANDLATERLNDDLKRLGMVI